MLKLKRYHNYLFTQLINECGAQFPTPNYLVPWDSVSVRGCKAAALPFRSLLFISVPL